MNESVAHIEQALEGIRLAPGSTHIDCHECRSPLDEGSPVTVAAVRLSDGDVWHVERVFGSACAPIVTGGTDIGAPVVLAEGDIGTVVDTAAQQHWPVLLDAVVIDTDIAGGAD